MSSAVDTLGTQHSVRYMYSSLFQPSNQDVYSLSNNLLLVNLWNSLRFSFALNTISFFFEILLLFLPYPPVLILCFLIPHKKKTVWLLYLFYIINSTPLFSWVVWCLLLSTSQTFLRDCSVTVEVCVPLFVPKIVLQSCKLSSLVSPLGVWNSLCFLLQFPR